MEYKRLQRAVTLLFFIIAFGTIGYYAVEHMTMFEAFYMTLITISTVGFSEIKPLTIYGRIITIIIISTGIMMMVMTRPYRVRGLISEKPTVLMVMMVM